ncbi:13238_t:CDS:1, partial [Funneliformis caledonium]
DIYYRNEEPGRYNFDKSWLFYPDVYWVTHWESNKLISGKDPLPEDYDFVGACVLCSAKVWFFYMPHGHE